MSERAGGLRAALVVLPAEYPHRVCGVCGGVATTLVVETSRSMILGYLCETDRLLVAPEAPVNAASKEPRA